MDTTIDRIDVPTRQPRRAVREPEIAWAHNPRETTAAQLAWFFTVPVVIALLVTAVVVTSHLAMH